MRLFFVRKPKVTNPRIVLSRGRRLFYSLVVVALPCASWWVGNHPSVLAIQPPNVILSTIAQSASVAPAATQPPPSGAALPSDGTQAVAPPAPPTAQLASATIHYSGSGYAWGNCTYYVATLRYIPGGWGNARNWYYAAERAGWRVGTVPTAGAIAWTSAGYFGHVAYVQQVSGNEVLVTEMNYYGLDRIDTRWVPAYLFHYIY